MRKEKHAKLFAEDKKLIAGGDMTDKGMEQVRLHQKQLDEERYQK